MESRTPAILSLLLSATLAGHSSAQADAVGRRTDAEGVRLPAAAVGRLGSTRLWHRDVIQPIAFAPDGQTLFVGTVDHEGLYAWDVTTGRLRWRNTFAVRKWDDPPSRRYISTRDIGFVGRDVAMLLPDRQGREGVVRFDPLTGQETGRVVLAPQTSVEQYRFSRDGSRVAVSHDEGLAVYDTATGRAQFAKRSVYRIRSWDGLDFSPDGRSLIVIDDEGGVHLLRADSAEPVRDFAIGGGQGGVRFAADGRTVVVRPTTGGWHPTVLLDTVTGAVRHRLQTAGESWHLWSMALDGTRLLTACRVYADNGGLGDYVVTWDIASGKEVGRFGCPLPHHLAVSPDGKVVATADGRAMELFDAATGNLLPQSAEPADGYRPVRSRVDSRWVGLAPRGLDTFDEMGRLLSRFDPEDPSDEGSWWSVLSPDGTRLARWRRPITGERFNPVEVWDAVAGKLVARFGREEGRNTATPPLREVLTVEDFSGDGKVLFTRRSDSDQVQAWDVATGTPVEPPGWVRAGIKPITFSPDGRWLADLVEVRDVHGDLERQRGGIGLADAEDGLVLVARRRPIREIPRAVRLVDAATGQAVLTLKVRPPRIRTVAFSPDGRTLAVAPGHETDIVNGRRPLSDDLVYLFEIPSGRELGRIRGPDGSVDHVAFSPDGRSIASAGGARTVRVWELATLGQRQTFPHARLVRTLVYSRDGRVLAVDGEDAPIDLWDVYGDRTRTGPKPDTAALDLAWGDLGSLDAAAGFRAVRTLVAAPVETVRLLRERLKTVGPEPREVGRSTPGALRAARSVEVLEAMNTTDARRLLGDLSRGPAGDRLTTEAQHAITRIGAKRTVAQ